MWECIKRVIKPRGAVVLFGSQPFTSALVMSNPKWFKYELIFKKGRSSGFIHAKNKPMKAHENILIFGSGTTDHASRSSERMTYNPQMEKGEPYKKKAVATHTGKLLTRPGQVNINFVGTVSENLGTRYPTSILSYSLHNVGLLHPTQKPVDLMAYLVQTYTNPGETVLDFTMGSGSTGVACAETGRNFIGIELDPHYFAVASERIEAAYRKAQGMPRLGKASDMADLPLFA